MQPNPDVKLLEEDADNPVELSPAELGVPWEGEEVPRKATPTGWFILIALILMGVGVWALNRLPKGAERFEEEVERVREVWDEDAREHQAALELLARVEDETRSYLRADTVEEKLQHVRHPERVRPFMENYYTRYEFDPVEFERITSLVPLGLESHAFFSAVAKTKQGEKVMLFAEQTPGGEIKFDWESEVAYQPMSIEQFLREKPTEGTDFRVYARIDNFYNFEFSDSERYRALMLTLRDSEQFLFGYVERGSETERELMNHLEKNIVKPQPALLRLRFLPGTQARRSVLVEKMLAPRWVHIRDPKRVE